MRISPVSPVDFSSGYSGSSVAQLQKQIEALKRQVEIELKCAADSADIKQKKIQELQMKIRQLEMEIQKLNERKKQATENSPAPQKLWIK